MTLPLPIAAGKELPHHFTPRRICCGRDSQPRDGSCSRPFAAQARFPFAKPLRRAVRDVTAVHGEVQALLIAGILQKTEKGQIVFPYDNVRVNFMLHAA